MIDDELPPDYLAAWALTQEEAIGNPKDGHGEVYISREGAHNPEPSLEWLGGDFGPDAYNFDSYAADRLLSENGYLRVGPWIEGSMNAREVRNKYAIAEGRSCEVIRVA